MTHDPLHPGRDDELGRALRTALDDPSGEGAFVASVLAGYRAPRLHVNDALASWSRWGLAAAAVVVITALLFLQPLGDAAASMDEALTESDFDAMATLMINESAPGTEILFSTDEDRR